MAVLQALLVRKLAQGDVMGLLNEVVCARLGAFVLEQSLAS